MVILQRYSTGETIHQCDILAASRVPEKEITETPSSVKQGKLCKTKNETKNPFPRKTPPIDFQPES